MVLLTYILMVICFFRIEESYGTRNSNGLVFLLGYYLFLLLNNLIKVYLANEFSSVGVVVVGNFFLSLDRYGVTNLIFLEDVHWLELFYKLLLLGDNGWIYYEVSTYDLVEHLERLRDLRSWCAHWNIIYNFC